MEKVIIAISGPTSAGKTYFSQKLLELADDRNIHSTRISTDEFYKDLSSIPMEERIKVNYDQPDSIDRTEFEKVIRSLSEGNDVLIPVYDFSTHTRTGEVRKVEPSELTLVEGIFALTFDEVREHFTISIYVDLEPDLRLIRRIMRDTKERGRSIESVFNQYMGTVRPTQKEFVQNDKEKADIIIHGDKDHTKVLNLLLNLIQ